MSESRRTAIVSILKGSPMPVTGSELAEQLDVSRQVIVQDIAVIRASGVPILATSSGYLIQTKEPVRSHNLIKTFVSKHNGFDRMEEELLVIVEYGGKIIDVVVEHPVYGEIVGILRISTVEDVKAFMSKVHITGAKPLSILTEGDHIHTIEVPSERIYDLIIKELKLKGFVVE